MDTDKLKSLIDNKSDCFVQIIKSHHRDFYNEIDSKYVGNKFSEKIYIHLYGEVTCKLCDNKPKFISFNKGYSKYCSKKCSNSATADDRVVSRKLTLKRSKYEKKSCLNCNSTFESLISRKQKFCSVKCSSSYTANDINRIDKIKKTKLQKYGDENFVNNEKAKQTNLRKYGVENVFENENVKDKSKVTNLKKYGSEYFFGSDEGKDKIRNSNLRKYGVQNPLMCDHIKKRIKTTVRKKYGVDNVFSSSEVQNKIKSTNLKKYGTEYPIQNDVIKEKIMTSSKLKNYNSVVDRITELTNIIPLFNEVGYVNTDRNNMYSFKCNTCNTEFEDHIDGGHLPRCLICHPKINGNSLIEREIVDYIQSIINDDIIVNDRSVLNGKEIDIYIPSKKIAIEFNGLYWHSELNGGRNKKYHINKTLECENKGIQLIHIFEDEWISKPKLLKKKLKYILNCDTNKSIYARKCEINIIDDCKSFLEFNHIQGNCPSKIKLGAFIDNELIAVMTFNNLRTSLGNKITNKDEYELLRFATSRKIVGIGSKLISFFIKKYNPFRIITFADRRYSIGSLYDKMNFKYVGISPPNYWYFKIGYLKRYHRYNFAKHTLKYKLKNFDKNISEWQNMQINGYDRIWDCGNLKYEFINYSYGK